MDSTFTGKDSVVPLHRKKANIPAVSASGNSTAEASSDSGSSSRRRRTMFFRSTSRIIGALGKMNLVPGASRFGSDVYLLKPGVLFPSKPITAQGADTFQIDMVIIFPCSMEKIQVIS